MSSPRTSPGAASKQVISSLDWSASRAKGFLTSSPFMTRSGTGSRAYGEIMKFKILLPAAATALSLTFATGAHAVCLPNFLPQFTTFARAGLSSQGDCEPVPNQSSTLGASTAGNGDTTSNAGRGYLCATSTGSYI